MDPTTQLLLAAALPALTAFAFRQGFARLGVARLGVGAGVAWAWGVALGFAAAQVGFVAAEFLSLKGEAPSLADRAVSVRQAVVALVLPHSAERWLAWVALIAAAVATLGARAGVRRRLALATGAGLAFALPARLLWGSVYFTRDWQVGQSILVVAGIGAALLLITTLAVRASRSDDSPGSATDGSASDGSATDGWARVLLTGFSLAGLAVVLVLSGSLTLGQTAGALASAVGGTLLGGFGLQRLSRWPAGAPLAGLPIAAVACGLLMSGAFYAELKPLNAALLVAALTMASTALPGRFLSRPISASLARTLFCLAPLAIALTLATAAYQRAAEEQPANPYRNWQPPGSGRD